MAATLTSSETFIRALKSPHDPPIPSGPSKIELATTAWATETFYVPGKAEVLVDWALGRMLKEKGSGEGGIVVDVRYWSLLSAILLSTNPKAHPRPVKSWLPPLLARTPTLPIFTAYFRSLRTSAEPEPQLCLKVDEVLAATLPYSLPKASFESVLECFGEVLRTIPDVRDNTPVIYAAGPSHSLSRSFSRVVTSFRTVYTNANNKKRALSPFVDTHLESWIQALDYLRGTADSNSLRQLTYQAGEDVLFSADSLRLYLDNPSDPRAFIVRFSQSPPSPALIRILPELMTSFIRSLRRHPTVLSSSSADINQATAVRLASLRFFQACSSMLPVTGESRWESRWECMLGLLRIIENEHAYDIGLEAWRTTLLECTESVVACLESGSSIVECTLALQTASVLLRVGYEIVKELLQRLLLRCVDMGPDANAAFEDCLDYLLDYHSKTRTVPSLFELFKEVASGMQLDSADPRELYESYAAGPFFSWRHQDKLETALVNFLTPNQSLQLIPELNAALRSFSEEPTDSRPAKRRKVSTKRARMEDGKSAQFALFSHLVAVAYRAVLRWDMDARTLFALLESAKDLAVRFLCPLVDAAASQTFSWPSSTKVAGAFRVLREIQSGALMYGDSIHKSFEVLNMDWVSRVQSKEVTGELRSEIIRTALESFLKDSSSVPASVISGVLDTALDLLESSDPSDVSGESRGAVSARLFVIEGCAVLNRIGTPTQLERATAALLEHFAAGTDLARTLSYRAEFWEYASLQKILLHLLAGRMHILGEDDVSFWLEQDNVPPFHEDDLMALSTVFKVVAMLPVGYLRQTERSTFLRCAIITDIAVSRMAFSISASMDVQQVLRLSTARLIEDTPSVSLPYRPLIQYLMKVPEGVTETFVLATASMIDALNSEIFRSIGSAPGAFQDLLAYYTVAEGSLAEPMSRVVQSRFQLSLLTKLFKMLLLSESGRSNNLRDALHSVGQLASNFIERTILPLQNVPLREILSGPNLVTLVECWSSASALVRRAAVAYPTSQSLEIRLMPEILASSPLRDASKHLCPLLFTIAVDASQAHENIDAGSIQALFEMHILLRQHGATSVEMDTSLRALSSRLPVEHKKLVLRGLITRMSTNISTDLIFSTSNDLHAIGCLLCDSSSGESMRSLFNGTLDAVCDLLSDQMNLDLSEGAIALMNEVSSQSGPSLIAASMDHIWAVLSLLLRPASSHLKSRLVYDGMLKFLTMLVRSHRDSIVDCMPQFTRIFSRLLALFRTPRLSLAPRQASVLENSFPLWITFREPLTTDDATKLSRLLEGLLMKLPSHLQTNREGGRGSQSFSKALSRHAPQIIRAYLESLVDPLCALTTEVRQELEPGMFALCSTMKEEDRDALMASLPSPNAKILLRRLWQEYDKQRYVGKG